MRNLLFICWFSCLLVVISCSAGKAQRNFPGVQLYSYNEGLSPSFVTSVANDRQGFLWVGTKDGLHRYDGYRFRSFRSEPADSTTISHNYITCLAAETLTDRLFAGTRRGLSVYDYSKGCFTRFSPRNADHNSLAEDHVYNLLNTADGYTWIRTANHLQCFDYSNQRFETFAIPSGSHPGSNEPSCFPLMEGPGGSVLFGTENGLYQLVPDGSEKNGMKLTMLPFEQIPIYSLCPVSDSSFIIGSSAGVVLFSLHSGQYELLSTRENSKNCTSIFLEAGHILWMGTENGIRKMSLHNGATEEYKYAWYEGNPVELLGIRDIITDRSQILWIATQNGLLKVDRKKPKFKKYNQTETSDLKLSGLNINALLADREGRLWVAHGNGGIDLFNRINSNLLRRYHSGSPAPIWNNTVNAILQDKRGTVWIGTNAGAGYCLPPYRVFRKHDMFTQDMPGENLSGMIIHHVYEDNSGGIWFGTNCGAFRYEPVSGSFFKVFPTIEELSDFTTGQIYCIHQDHSGNFWFGTFSGLYRLDLFTAIINRIMPANGNHSPPAEISALYQDPEGRLWVGSGSGLQVVDMNVIPHKMTMALPELKNEPIHALTGDAQNNLWMSTNNGIISFDPATGEWRRFNINDGLLGNEFRKGAFCRDENGELFFGGTLGINSFHPDSIRMNTHIPSIVITHVDKILQGRKETFYVDGLRGITIKPGETAFTIAFAALDFTNPGSNRFEYLLEGYDRKWISSQGQQSVTYTNLPYGRYVFRVKGSNNDQIWNTTGTSLEINVKTSVFTTRVAMFLYLVAIIFWVYLFFRFRTRNLRRSNTLLKEKEMAGIEIARQKEELAVKNKNITDSINYARKIQDAMLPSAGLFSQILPDSFVLFKPRDIVSGDFYWVNKKDAKIFLAAVDCTGHGVPGALMSMIGFELLRNIINYQQIEEPATILDKLNKGIADAFNKEVERITLKDGMDLSFCAIDTSSHMLQFAGAFNPVYLVRDETITELKGDRISVGLSEDPEKERFKNHVIPVENSDVIYMFTDGYVDQFGGPKEKKFMYRRFRHLLLTIHKLPMDQQKIILEETMEHWKGDFEQVDDILVIGFRPKMNYKG